ncbi:amino acid ABC transporter, permease/ATP-binding protein CydD, putaive [Hyphomonas neptunium ATCC 15444]|uniref:Amino acid ABC transporter, permease/ATP-binding protein CydD, putaive n=2 Tax=Hyphomonas TaxID=85 RepID=Q0C1M5_HYPNA|nr:MULTISPECIES: thiol reductant ABC exporter subunit CydD [Hyphomonas]ABI78829.1 amino acid ABC transporter, permease/ATP-binding protein CydD, putaive [Hyphomonas neptunium ATCC 15444]KCZ92548.1 amino acid ABC transporter permease/ATP-binding protein CydD [Hyphomonas hirschiana VP5]
MAETGRERGSGAKHWLKRWRAAARGAAGLALLMQVVGLLAWIAIAFGVGYGVDNLSRGEPVGWALGIAAGAAFVRALAGWAHDGAAARAGVAIVDAGRAEIFAALKLRGAGLLEGADAGTRTSQVIDRTRKLAGYAARWLPGQQMAVIGPVIVLVAVATQSWLATVLLLVSVLVLPGFIWLTLSEVAAVARAQQASLDQLSGAFQVRAAQAGIIRAFRAVTRETAALAEASDALRERTMKVLRVAFLSTAVLEFFASVSVAMVAVYVGFKLLGVFPFETGETLTLAEGLTVLILVPEFFAPIRKLSALHHDRADGTAAAEFLGRWLEGAAARPLPVKLPSLEGALVIEFRNVSVAFGEGVGLQGVSFTVRPGEMAALAGPSGAGKTTLLKLLLGQGVVTGGEVVVDGIALAPGASLGDSVTWISQTPWMVEGSVAENLQIARADATDAELRAAVIAVGLADEAGAGAMLARKLGRGGSGLSGGQRQRIGLARVMLRGSGLLLLDEPTAHLDDTSEADFIAILRDICRTRTVLLGTHSDKLKTNCDTVVDVSRSRVEGAV